VLNRTSPRKDYGASCLGGDECHVSFARFTIEDHETGVRS
jgi:hypothetical protein